jgi:hypothetical protein
VAAPVRYFGLGPPQSARELLTHQRARLLLEPPVGHGDSRLGQRVPKLWGASILD